MTAITDFASARNLHFPTDAMVAEMTQALPAAMRRPGSTQAILNQKLASYLRCDPSRVQALHGASQILPILKRMAGTRPVLRPEPALGEYSRVFPKASLYRDSPGVDLDALDKTIKADAIVIIITPNSPTGTVVPTQWIHNCARGHGHTLFVVDESFIDFSGETSMVERLEADPVENVFVIKSLSASLGVPGLRLGYVYTTNPEVICVLDDEIPIGNLSGPAEFYLELMLKYRPDLERSLDQTKADREEFAAILEATPAVARVHPSGGNFLLIDLRARDPILGARVREQMLARFGIDVTDVSTRLLPHAPRLRVAVRLPHENQRFCEALTAVAATL